MQRDKPWQEIRTDVRTLYADHLAHALDLLHLARADAEAPSASAQALHSRRRAMSAIIHGFCSIEAVLNFMAYRIFTLEDSPEYIPTENRDFFLQSMIRRWDKLRLVEKCNAVLTVSDGALLPNGLQSRLSEVNTLRNWIVHGTCYHSTLLVSPAPEVHIMYEVVDEERGKSWKDWEDKFPTCKFNQPLALDHTDAQTALRIVIEALLTLSRRTGFKWFFTTCVPNMVACGLDGSLESDLDRILGIEKTEPDKCSVRAGARR